MRLYDIIRKKRDGGALSDDELRHVVLGYARGDVPDYQVSALLMAIFLRGMDSRELGTWTQAMIDSGESVDFAGLGRATVDKHSTGGVGDKISIPLAPLVAACGVAVPMVSGRGLGHTGGTLDKLEAIPGFRVDLDIDKFKRLVRENGLCLIGQTATFCPADRKLYALRDVTGTVESIPLIASSIMSKKLAEGIDGLVLDVKCGSGAFMKREEDARTLAQTMVGIGRAVGKRVTAVLTDMSQPLGRAAGNANEIAESIAILRGGGPADVLELTLVLGAEMLMLGGVAKDPGEARARLERAIADGSGLERFRRCVAAQGGDPAVCDAPERVLPQPTQSRDVAAAHAGYVRAVDTEAVGIAAILLGAGREKKEDRIDPAAGITVHTRLGQRVSAGEPLVTLHYNAGARVDDAEARIRRAYVLGDTPPEQVPALVRDTLR